MAELPNGLPENDLFALVLGFHATILDQDPLDDESGENTEIRGVFLAASDDWAGDDNVCDGDLSPVIGP